MSAVLLFGSGASAVAGAVAGGDVSAVAGAVAGGHPNGFQVVAV